MDAANYIEKIRAVLIEEDKKMGTAGWLLKNINSLPEQFIVMNADTYYSENIIEKKESDRFLKSVQNLTNLKQGQLDKLNIVVRKSKLKRNLKKGIF